MAALNDLLAVYTPTRDVTANKAQLMNDLGGDQDTVYANLLTATGLTRATASFNDALHAYLEAYQPLGMFDWKAAFYAGDPLFVEPDVAYTDASAGLVLPGVSGNCASVPDEAALDITGDLDVRCKVALDDWTPTATGFVSHANGAVTSGYTMEVHGARLKLFWDSPTGTLSATSTSDHGITDGQTKWVRATLDVDNGAGGYDVNFYLSDDGESWSQLGSTVTGGATTSIEHGTSLDLLVGGRTGSIYNAAGDFYRAQVFDGIDGTKVLDVDFQRARTASFTASTGQTVTVHSGAPVSAWRNGGTTRTEGAYLSTVGLVLPGTSGNFASVDDEAALDITGDITIVSRCTLTDWTPAAITAVGAKATLASIAYVLVVNTDGTLSVITTADGSTQVSGTSTAAVSAADGTAKWVAGTLDVDNGASGRDYTFWTSDDGVTWTQLGSTVTVGATTSIVSNSTPFYPAGVFGQAVYPVTGSVQRSQVWSGSSFTTAGPGGTKVLDIDFTGRADVNKFTCSTGQTVTVTNTLDAQQATGTKQPAYRASVAALNDRPAIQGDGVDDFLATADWDSTLSEISIVVVGAINSSDAATRYMVDGSPTYRATVGRASTGEWIEFAGLKGGTADTDPHLFRVAYTVADHNDLYVDETLVADGSNALSGFDRLSMFANANGSSNPANAHIAFVGAYPGDITAEANWPAFVAWVESEYGIAVA